MSQFMQIVSIRKYSILTNLPLFVFYLGRNCPKFHVQLQTHITGQANSHLNLSTRLKLIIIHQTHYEKSDWSRTFNQFTIACELEMINVISATDITFIMSS